MTAQRITRIQEVLKSIDELHKQVAITRSKTRDAAIRRHNRKTHVQDVNFEVGDFVLVAKRVASDGHKLRVLWRGPRRVVRALSDLIYECEDLISGVTDTFHANRLKFYAERDLDVSEDLLETINHNEPHLQTIERIQKLRFNKALERYEVEVKWRGFDHEEPTWEPLETMHEDVPTLLHQFLQRCRNKKLAHAARATLSSK